MSAAELLAPDVRERIAAYRMSLESALPGGVAGVVLFGSWAHGDARLDSDFDLAVLLPWRSRCPGCGPSRGR